MRKLSFVFAILAMAFVMHSCGRSTEKQVKETSKVETIAEGNVVVYYFHGKQRCKTCVGIQNVSQEAIAEAFADNTKVRFVEVDFSEKINTALADKYEIAFSSLVVAISNEQTNLTEFAFANVNSNPNALKETLIGEVNNYLNKE